MVRALKSNNNRQGGGLLSQTDIEGSLLPLEYLAARAAEARARVARILNIDNNRQSEGLLCPAYIRDSPFLLEYLAARTAEACARVEEHLTLARLNIESSKMVRHLEAASESFPEAKEKLVNGELF
jgi:hypothetical protein